MTETADNFVDFQNVWLAYNDELLAQEHFAVEDINLQVKQGEFPGGELNDRRVNAVQETIKFIEAATSQPELRSIHPERS